MNEILDIEIILRKQKYSKIYNIGIWLLIIMLIFTYISLFYTYKTYYVTKGTMSDGDIKMMVGIEDIKYIAKNKRLQIDSVYYEYNISKISEELYLDDSMNNYKWIYLKVKGLDNINNYVYEIKIVKNEKKIIEYIKEYL